jgi:iron complex outermembrane receptor protein
VINIVTQSADQTSGVEVSAGAGSFATQQYNVLAGHHVGAASLSGFFQFSDMDGPRLPVPADAQTATDRFLERLGVPPVSLAPGTTHSQRRSLDGNVQLVFKGLTVNGRFKDQDSGGYVGLVDVLGPRTLLEARQISIDATYRRARAGQRGLEARVGFNQNMIGLFLELYPPGFTQPVGGSLVPHPDGVLLDSELNTRRFNGSLTWSRQLFPHNELTVGVDLEKESTYGLKASGNFDVVTGAPLAGFEPVPSAIPPSSRSVVGAYFQDAWDVSDHLGLTAGLRFDRYDDFGSTVNPRAGLVWRLPRGLDLKLLYGRAFRAPSFFELFVQLPGISGNPELRPTTVNSFEASLGYRKRNLRVNLNYYANFLRDIVVPESAFLPSGATTLVNARGLDVQGIELEVKRTFGLDHSFFANYSYQRPRDAATGERVPKVPSHLANLGATRGFGRHVGVTSTVRFRSSRRRTILDIRPPLEARALVDLSVRIRNLFETLEISGTAQNLFDTDYADPAPRNTLPGDYPRAGRSILVKATYKF